MQGDTSLRPLAVLYFGALLGGFNENLMNMALLSVMDEFQIGAVTAQWLVTGYMIVATVVVVCMAFLYRRVSLRKLLFAAAGLSAAGSVIGLFAIDFWTLMLARMVQAVGTGIFIPMMVNTVLALAPRHQIGKYMAIGNCTITFGPAFAPVVCGGIVTAFGWRYVFIVPAVAAALVLVAGALVVRNLQNQEVKLDVLSVALSAAFLLALTSGLTQLASDLLLACALLGVAAAVVIVFVARQLSIKNPLIDLAPVKRLSYWPSLVLLTVVMMCTFSTGVLLPLYFEGGLGFTARTAGLLMLVPILVNAVISLLGGRIVDHVGAWPLLPVGFGAVAVGLGILAFASQQLSLLLVMAGALVAYSGVGLIFSPSQTAGLRTLPAAEHPHGVALGSTFIQIAACIGPSLFTGILASVEASALLAGGTPAVACAQGFAAAMGIASCIAATGCAVALAYARFADKNSIR